MAKKLLNIPVIGLVENMAAYVCADCGKAEDLFPAGDAEEMARQFEVPLLGKIPFDPHISIAGDEGIAFVEKYRSTPAGNSVVKIAEKIESFFNHKI